MSFRLMFCSFVSVPSLFKKEIDAFDYFGIEWLVVAVLSVDVSYVNTLMILIERILCWLLFMILLKVAFWF